MGGAVIGPRPVAQWGKAVARRFVVAIEGFAFWVAIALPFLYGSGLFLYGSELVGSRTLFGLVFLNLVALVIGHRHKNPGRDAASSDERSSGVSGE